MVRFEACGIWFKMCDVMCWGCVTFCSRPAFLDRKKIYTYKIIQCVAWLKHHTITCGLKWTKTDQMSCGGAKCSFQINLREARVDQLLHLQPFLYLFKWSQTTPPLPPTLPKPLQFWNTANNICGNFSTPSKVAQLRRCLLRTCYVSWYSYSSTCVSPPSCPRKCK